MLSLLVFPEHLRARIRLVRSVSRFCVPTKSRKVFTGLIEDTMVLAEYSTPFSSFTPVATESDIISELTFPLKTKSTPFSSADLNKALMKLVTPPLIDNDFS